MQTGFPQLSQIMDISMDTGAYTFPGNPPLERSGPHNRVSGPVREYVYDLRLCTQSGTHIQSGHYFLEDGETLDQVALERCQGWCRLIPLVKRGEDTTRKDLEALFRQHPLQERMILFVTGQMEDIIATGTCAPESRSGLSPEAAAYLVEERGVTLLGIDSLGLESRSFDDFRVTRYLGSRGVLLLECLVNLKQLPPFSRAYLEAFPLNIAGVEGTPCRAVLRIPREKSS